MNVAAARIWHGWNGEARCVGTRVGGDRRGDDWLARRGQDWYGTAGTGRAMLARAGDAGGDKVRPDMAGGAWNGRDRDGLEWTALARLAGRGQVRFLLAWCGLSRLAGNGETRHGVVASGLDRQATSGPDRLGGDWLAVQDRAWIVTDGICVAGLAGRVRARR